MPHVIVSHYCRIEEWSFEVGTTVAVGILLALSLAVAMVLYWRYREEESHYLQVGFTVYIVYRVQQRLWFSTGDTGRRSPTTYR